MSDEIPPQFSPDGRYWWDGEQWIPIDQLPKPVPSRDAGPAWSTDGGGPRRSPALLIVVAIVVIVVLAVAAVVTGVATGRIQLPRLGGTPAASPTAVRTPTPTPTPTTPVFAGTTAPNLLTYLSTNQIDCNPPVVDHGNQWWYCSLRGGPPYNVGFAGKDEQHILQMQAQVKDPRPSPDQAQAASFLTAVAGFAYTGGNPSQAQSWVQANMNGGTTVIGQATFKITHPAAGTWTLSIYPL